jgi:hypothetical protein
MLRMVKKVFAFLLLVSSVCAPVQGQEKEPVWAFKFPDYAVTEVFKGRPAQPILTGKTHKMFRTAIRDAARKGPNFAGHFTVAEWGCGSGCVSVAVVDAASGRVFDAPFKILSMPLSEGAKGHEYQGSVYQLKSKLLIADGCPEEKKCGTYYYEWTANRFKLLRYDPQP